MSIIREIPHRYIKKLNIDIKTEEYNQQHMILKADETKSE